MDTLVEDVVVGAMSAHNMMKFLQNGTLLITPADREDILLATAASLMARGGEKLAGIVLTGGFRPTEHVRRAIDELSLPVLLARADSYRVASKVHDLTVKTRPRDAQKISLIRDLVTRNVDVKKIVASL
jgi:BioD-like phosphotransacetylase family protein